MTATTIAAPAEADLGAELERLAGLAAEGFDVMDDVLLIACPLLSDEEKVGGWEALTEAIRERDGLSPAGHDGPAIHWSERYDLAGLGPEEPQEAAWQLAAADADEALRHLMHGGAR